MEWQLFAAPGKHWEELQVLTAQTETAVKKNFQSLRGRIPLGWNLKSFILMLVTNTGKCGNSPKWE